MPKTKTAADYIPAAEIPWLYLYFPAGKQTAALPVIGHELVRISNEVGLPALNTLYLVYDAVHAYH